MKATGIVRRLDDLGRLVIPKEIRKQYRLKEGDSIEFFIENDKIVIQKFDVISKHLEEINIMVETLEDLYKNPVLFLQEEWLHLHNIKVEEAFYKAMEIRRVVKFENEKVYVEEDTRFDGVVYPIVVNGDWYGAFVLVFKEEDSTNEDFHAMDAFSKLLSRQQEQ